MRRFGFAITVCLLLCCAVARAQGEPPMPGPEHQKLGYFAGQWTTAGQTKANPFGIPAGPFTSRDSCEWFEGGFSVVCSSEGTGAMGPTKGIGIMGYNTEEKVYTYYGVDSGPMAMTSIPKGRVDGDTWTYTDESMMGGKTVKSRYIIKQHSPASYSFHMDIMGEDGNWQTIFEGESTKAP